MPLPRRKNDRPTKPNGRPTKRTEAVLKPLFEAIKIGVPYKLACMAAGISYDCFNHWRKQDPEFDQQVEQAAAQPALKLFNTIRQQAPETWQAGAWALERRYPDMFAKPEAQLNIVATAQAAATGPTNVIVLGPERAKVLATRYQQIRAQTLAMFEEPQTNTGNGEQAEAQPPRRTDLPAFAAVVEEATGPTVPTSERSPPFAWWRQFLFPVLGTLIHKAEATKALRLILSELRIGVEEQRLSFQTDHITQATFCEVLEKLTGGDLGWRTMVQSYERELRRSDH